MKDIKDYIYESKEFTFKFQHQTFTPKDFITWMVKTNKFKYDYNEDAETNAQAAQDAAENLGLEIEYAEYIYDAAYDDFDKKY